MRFFLISSVVVFGLGSGWFLPIWADEQATVEGILNLAVCGDGVRESAEQCDGADLGGRVCADLGYTGGTLSCGISCEYEVEACDTSSLANDHFNFPAINGGQRSLTAGNHQLEIALPSNFYSEDLTLFSFIEEDLPEVAPTKPTNHRVGKVYNFIYLNRAGNFVPVLSKKAMIDLVYDDEDVVGLDETTLRPYRWRAGSETWSALADYSLDIVNNTVSISTADFSYIAIFGSPPAPVATSTVAVSSPSSSGGSGFLSILFSPSLWFAPRAGLELSPSLEVGTPETTEQAIKSEKDLPAPEQLIESDDSTELKQESKLVRSEQQAGSKKGLISIIVLIALTGFFLILLKFFRLRF